MLTQFLQNNYAVMRHANTNYWFKLPPKEILLCEAVTRSFVEKSGNNIRRYRVCFSPLPRAYNTAFIVSATLAKLGKTLDMHSEDDLTCNRCKIESVIATYTPHMHNDTFFLFISHEPDITHFLNDTTIPVNNLNIFSREFTIERPK